MSHALDKFTVSNLILLFTIFNGQEVYYFAALYVKSFNNRMCRPICTCNILSCFRLQCVCTCATYSKWLALLFNPGKRLKEFTREQKPVNKRSADHTRSPQVNFFLWECLIKVSTNNSINLSLKKKSLESSFHDFYKTEIKQHLSFYMLKPTFATTCVERPVLRQIVSS